MEQDRHEGEFRIVFGYYEPEVTFDEVKPRYNKNNECIYYGYNGTSFSLENFNGRIPADNTLRKLAWEKMFGDRKGKKSRVVKDAIWKDEFLRKLHQ